MRFTRTSVILAVVGVLLLVAAGLVRFVYLPSASRLPADFDVTQSYSGTYTGLNPAVLAGGTGNALVTGAPVTAARQYRTSSVDGDTAVVSRTLTQSLAGRSQPPSTVNYAVDRGTFESTTPPSGSTDVVRSQGWIFSLPLHPATTGSGYKLWDEATAQATPLAYQGTSSIDGRSTYRYTTTAQGTLADPAAYGLPASMTRGQLTNLGPALASLLPATLQAQLPAILAALPATVPIAWTSSSDVTLYADATTGAPIRVQDAQRISGGISVLGRTLAVPLASFDLKTTSASEATIADDAASNASMLTLVGTTIPIILLVLGVVVLVLAIVLAVRNGRHPGGAAPTESRGTPTPARV